MEGSIAKSFCGQPEWHPIEKIVPNPRNPYKHSERQIKLLAKIIAAHGWRHPILISKRSGFIVAGHARLKAAKENGWEKVPVDFQEFENDAQEWAVLLADNQIDEFRKTDDDKLQELALELGPDFDFELAALPDLFIPGLGKVSEDEDQEEPIELRTGLGDLWQFGGHSLLVGDSTKQEDVSRLYKIGSPILMVTDPPYGVMYDPEWRDGADLGIGKRSKGKVANDHRIDWKEAWDLFQGDAAYVWHAGVHTATVLGSLTASDFLPISQIIWAKQHFVMSRGDYHWQHEPCWYVVRKGKNHNWQGARDQSTLWMISNNNAFGGQDEEKFGHGTQKPVDCMRKPMINNSSKGDFIYDPFLGSGTSLIAAETSQRRCLGIEIDPKYATICLNRWEKFSGNKAEKIE